MRYNNTLRDTVPKSIFKKENTLDISNFHSSERIPNDIQNLILVIKIY